jgi:uncharacterized protein (DUF433 family)
MKEPLMTVLHVTPQAYEIIARRAQETRRTPDEVASQIITAQAATTEHPYVERRYDVLGGKPTIKGTRLAVWQIVERIKLGDSPDDLLNAYSHLPAAAIYDAISYYYDHREEIEAQIEENRLENALARHNAVMDERGRITFQGLANCCV